MSLGFICETYVLIYIRSPLKIRRMARSVILQDQNKNTGADAIYMPPAIIEISSQSATSRLV